MIHSFDIDIAKELDVNSAIIYQNIVFWCEKNRANNINFHDGEYWTYNSKTALLELFPYMTYAQIKKSLSSLYDGGYIGKGQYNENPYDRTNWYCDLRQKQRLKDNQSIGYTEPINRSYEATQPATQNQCITDSKHTDSNTDSKKEINKENSFSKQDCQDVIDCLEQNTKRRFRKINDSVRSKFNARIKDGYTIEDIKTAIVNASQNQYHKETGFQYLTPEFFSRPATLDKWSVSTTQTEESNLKPKRIDWSKSKEIDL